MGGAAYPERGADSALTDSFIGISKAHTTNLAVVAPGIAEALLATALGLVDAIPFVVHSFLVRAADYGVGHRDR